MGSSPTIFGVKTTEIFELPPPRSDKINRYKLHLFEGIVKAFFSTWMSLNQLLFPYITPHYCHVAPISIVVQVMEPLSASCPNRCHVVSGWNRYYTLPPKKRQRIFLESCLGLPWGGATYTQVKRLIIQLFKAKSQPKHMNLKRWEKVDTSTTSTMCIKNSMM